MKQQKFPLVLVLAVILAGCSSAQAIQIDATTGQPSIGVADVFSYATPVVINDGGRDYSNNPYNTQEGAPGQTFTATSTGNLTAITIQGVSGNAGLGYQGATFNFDVYSVGSNGIDLTFLGGGDYTFADQTSATDYSGDYLTFNLPSAVSVTTGDVYAFSFSSGGGYYGVGGSSSDVYSGGIAIDTNGDPSVSPSTAINQSITSYDRNFDAHISAAPEPSTWAMLAGGLVVLAAWQSRRFRA
jgi:hypothetical protein